ncbi:MAG: hypothetical protein AAFU55_12670, partial [Pseudomonadota bacterium]
MSTAKSLARIACAACLLLASLAAARADELPPHVIEQFGQPPAVPEGPLSEDLQRALQVVFVDSLEQSAWERDQITSLLEIADSGDPRLVWVIADMMRFTWRRQFDDALAAAGAKLLQIEFDDINRWGILTDHLIAWDIPAYPGYLETKRAIFTNFVPGWDRIFVPGEIDWRMVSWGGVLIDARGHDETDDLCNCIPAADNPEVSTAEEATWPKTTSSSF